MFDPSQDPERIFNSRKRRNQVLPNELLDQIGKLDEEQLEELSTVIEMTLEQKEEEETKDREDEDTEDLEDDEEEETEEVEEEDEAPEKPVDIDTNDI